MNKYVILVCFSCSLLACYKNDECRSAYVGTFKIDTSIISNQIAKGLILNYKWDTVKLVSTNNGVYYFLVNDPLLKACEGKWYIKSNDLEGNCFGYVKQKNMSSEFISMPFDIWIKISGETYTLPFRRVDSKK